MFCDHNLSGPADGISVVWVTVSVAHDFARITEGGLGYGATSTSAIPLHDIAAPHSKKTDFVPKRREVQ